ncbi:MtrAB system histidine kinase MtrB [Microbacterium sp. NC79]|uniref:MtrAB system histidine kinase MtrB n=1 Tax=Microbacterium sp. NC79 TaxID=2851009 RepID=UPI001C2C5F51|nr:MtrAB system histidine kinase MtrB [Microbacterium sp. NC79]MBV0894353.1 HAMP domain-containing histidine kinase [Microbacterium sp. NC79]
MTSATRLHAPRTAGSLPATWSALWKGSVRFRTTVLTVALSALAVIIACVWMALAIQDRLYEARKDQAMNGALQAAAEAQSLLDAANPEGDPGKLQEIMGGVQTRVASLAGTDYARIMRSPAEASTTLAPVPWVTRPFEANAGMLTEGLRERVREQNTRQWLQAVEITMPSGDLVPGILIGQSLRFPEVGMYELYLAYPLDEEQQTLLFVQRTLWLAAVALLFIIGLISWFVMRSVTAPIREAAETSAQLARGDLGVRIVVDGEDELATLGRSFNAMADSLEGQIKELAALSLVQQRFVSDVSHELRTPLTTIRLAADMINDNKSTFDPTTERAAELLHAQVERFEVLLGDLLEISRYDAGSVQLEIEPTSLAHLAEDVIDSMQQLADQHGSNLRLVAPGGYSPVDMDARRVRRVVRNLIGNAIEHGEGKPVVVTVDSNQQAVAIGVRDFGLGIKEEHIEHVFDRFWRADPSRKRTIGGTGLGLSIALGDAKLHGGTLTVWSDPGNGSHFVLTLPRVVGGEISALSSPIAAEGEDAETPMGTLGLTQPIDVIIHADQEGKH